MPAKTEVADIVDRRNESRKYMQANYWDEWEDVYRAVKCRTKPIMTTDRAGNSTEDTTRTNVCMPELSLIRRRKVARLTANPPQINYLTPQGENDPVAEKLTARAFQCYDRSGESKEHRRLVDSAITFGRGISKLRYDTVDVMRRVRKPLLGQGDAPAFKDRRSLMEFQGKGEEEIDSAVENYGTELDEDLIKQLLQDAGKNEIQGKVQTQKYSGPIVTNVFVGDFFDEPGCRTLDESAWAVEAYWETDIWLQKMVRKRFIDPDGGKEIPVFSVKAAEELMDMLTPNTSQSQQQPFDLRTRLRTAATNQATPMHPSRLVPGKRFDILESHQRDEYGAMWITWVGNEKVLLGKMPYPWDLYGKYTFSEFVPMPDILNAIGDSMPRLLRWLHFLHNSTVGQRKDLVNAILRPIMLLKFGEDVPDEAIERRLMRVIQMKDLGSLRPLIEAPSIGQALSGANEEEAQILRMMAMAEPNMNTVDTGTESNPMAGKLATTAVLNAKAADTLTQDELNGLNTYLKDLGEKKLWMDQQAMQEPQTIGPQYANKVQGLSERYGKAATITLDPMEIQEDIQVEPAAMSMLSVDDDIRRTAALQFYQFASQDPVTFNKNYAATFLATTIRGIDPGKAVNPPAPPSPPPPKVNISIAVKYDELPPNIQAGILGGAGLQVDPQSMQEMDESAAMKDIGKVSAASDHATNIMSPPQQPDQEPETNLTRGIKA